MPPSDSSFEQWRRTDFVSGVDGLVVDKVPAFAVDAVRKVSPMAFSEDEVSPALAPDE